MNDNNIGLTIDDIKAFIALLAGIGLWLVIVFSFGG
jgi:hypothetical protein